MRLYRDEWAKCTRAYGHEPRFEQWTAWLAARGLTASPTFYNEWPRI